MSIRRILRCMLWLSIDHFGLLATCNLLTVLFALPVITFPLGLAGSLNVCEKLLARRSALLRDYWEGIGRFGVRLYLWTTILILLWIWCFLAFRFYSAQLPLLASIGCMVAMVCALSGSLIGYVMLPRMALTSTHKNPIWASVGMILDQGRKIALFTVTMIALECLLIVTGLGFFVLGLVLPILAGNLLWIEYGHLRHSKPLYEEQRTLKDFFLPVNLLK